MPENLNDVLSQVGARLRNLRTAKGQTLAELAEATDISISTLSRLESGKRKATLELLVPLAREHQVPLDDLISPRSTDDPRVFNKPVEREGLTLIPLTNHPGPHLAYKMILHAGRPHQEPDPKIHDGREWLYVLSGRLRLVLDDHDLVLTSGEAAEFDTRTPHWFSSADTKAVEFIVLFSEQGERIHLRAKPMPATSEGES
jgi:transcriptional regulator with XRE-family HTH domain